MFTSMNAAEMFTTEYSPYATHTATKLRVENVMRKTIRRRKDCAAPTLR